MFIYHMLLIYCIIQIHSILIAYNYGYRHLWIIAYVHVFNLHHSQDMGQSQTFPNFIMLFLCSKISHSPLTSLSVLCSYSFASSGMSSKCNYRRCELWHWFLLFSIMFLIFTSVVVCMRSVPLYHCKRFHCSEALQCVCPFVNWRAFGFFLDWSDN